MNDRLNHLFIALGALLLLVVLAIGWTHWVGNWFYHPLGGCTGTPHQMELCKGYNSWSGILGSFLFSLPGWGAAGALWWRHHNCGQRGCWLVGHPHPEHNRPVCGKHFNKTPSSLREHHGLPEEWHRAREHHIFQV